MRMIGAESSFRLKEVSAVETMLVEEVFGELLVADPAVADREEVAAIVRGCGEVRSWLASIEVRCARRSSELAAAGAWEPRESLLGDDGNRSPRDAVGITRRSHACDAMPS